MLTSPFFNSFCTKTYLRAMFFALRLKVLFPAKCDANVLSMETGTLGNPSVKPNYTIMFLQKSDCFIAMAVATSFASMVD